MRTVLVTSLILSLSFCTLGCQTELEKEEADITTQESESERLLGKYTTVRLTADLSVLSDHERQIIPLVIEAAQAMDRIFWKEAYGDRSELLDSISDPGKRRFAEINYGPWDRLAGNEPFLDGVGKKPDGANFYPVDMTIEEFNQKLQESPETKYRFSSLYTLVRRKDQDLMTVPYREAFADDIQIAVEKLRAAASLSENPQLQHYLNLRAEAFLTDEYQPSDLAWMDMKNNRIEVVIGPIKTYEDQLFGYKAAHEAYVLIKDMEWSERLTRYAALLPELQRGLPVPAEYKKDEPGAASDLNAYDAIYYAGDCNAGSKTIAINLPNDEEVQLRKGTRRLQLKNAMRAKFNKILVPISNLLIVEDQRQYISFDAFFQNTMFHEVDHGLGIKNTLDSRGTVRQALREQASAFEEGKADVLGLYMVLQLFKKGDLGSTDVKDNMVTFMASIFRSIRFGSSSAHGNANLMRFNFFKGFGAFSREEGSGAYRVNFEKFEGALNALSEKILVLQGDGDYEGAKNLMQQMGQVGTKLQTDIDRLASAGIPTDIVFEQGMSILQ